MRRPFPETQRPIRVFREDLAYFDEIRPGFAASLERRGLIAIVDGREGRSA